MLPLTIGAASPGPWPQIGLLGFVALVVVWILVKAWKHSQRVDQRDIASQLGATRGRSGSGYENRTKVTLGLDGFWLEVSGVSPGALIVYHYLCNEKWHVGRVRYRPGTNGQFVYTGDRPEKAEVLDVQSEGADGIEFDSSSSSDTTNFNTPAAAWYATQDGSADAPTPRQDPPAY